MGFFFVMKNSQLEEFSDIEFELSFFVRPKKYFETRNQLRALPYYPFILFYCFESDYFLVQFSLHHLNMYRKVF